jgi:hypothetical protein
MRDIAYWQHKLSSAQRALAEFSQKFKEWEPAARPLRHGGFRSRRRFKRRWLESRRAYFSLRHRMLMLMNTKIPYYEERIRALTPTSWDRLGQF